MIKMWGDFHPEGPRGEKRGKMSQKVVSGIYEISQKGAPKGNRNYIKI